MAGRLRVHHCTEAEDVALLLVSELVTNAMLHAQTEAEVEVECHDHTVRVAVSDGVPAGIDPESGHQSHTVGAPSGRGLRIVDALAHRWGVSVHEAGKTVWFELNLVAEAPGSSRL